MQQFKFIDPLKSALHVSGANYSVSPVGSNVDVSYQKL
jgi:hypothetical protein